MDNTPVPETVPPEVQAEFAAALDEYEARLRAILDKLLQEIDEALSEHEEQ